MRPTKAGLPCSVLIVGALATACTDGSGAGPNATSGAGSTPVVSEFLRRPITGARKVLFYWVEYPGVGGQLPSLSNLCPGSSTGSPAEDFAAEIERILENNAYGTLDVQPTATLPLLMPMPIAAYDTGCSDNLLRVLEDARQVAASHPHQPFQGAWDWRDFDYEVVLTQEFWTRGPQGGGGFNKNFRVSFCSPSSSLVDLTLHEMGHGFKFEHASYWQGAPLGPGPLLEYGDEFDPMGAVANPQQTCERHYNPRHKLWAGWIAPERVPVVDQDGSYTIRKLEDTGPGGLRGIRVRASAQLTYFVFYRGDDQQASALCYAGRPCNGVILTRSEESNLRAAQTILLNANPLELPANQNWTNALLPEGTTFDDGTIQISADQVLPGSVTVHVEFDGDPFTTSTQPPIDQLPVIDILSPEPGEILTGPIAIEVLAHDPDVGPFHFDGLREIVIGFGEVGPGQGCGTLQFGTNYEYEHCWSFLDPDENTWVFDPLPNLLCDGANAFVVEAHDLGGNAQKVRFRFLSENGHVCCPP